MISKETSSVAFYDALWQTTNRVDQHHQCRSHAVRKMLSSIRKSPGQRLRILEPGCGSGILSKTLADYGEVTGIDQSMVGIEKAKLSVPGRFSLGTLPSIEISENDFDLCVVSQVLEHFYDNQQVELLQNIHRYVKQEGHLIVTTPNKNVSSAIAFKPGELQPIENWLDPQALTNMLERTGWRVESTVYCFNFFPILTSRFPWLRPIRYFIYQIMHLRGVIEDMTDSWGIGDCTVMLARKK